MKDSFLRGMNTQAKTGVGAALATLGALAIVLSLLLGWTEAPGPWAFLFDRRRGL